MSNKNKLSAHTLGPWISRAEENGINIIGERYVCTLSDWAITAAGGQYDKVDAALTKEREANAALIESAPELYAIMREVYEASRFRRPIKKATFEAVCEVLRKVDGNYR